MSVVSESVLLVAAVGSGLVGGLCFAFSSFLLRSFDDLGAPAAIRVMQSLNTRILRSSAMVLWIGTVALGAAKRLFDDHIDDTKFFEILRGQA